jgi:hypothetical protein
VLPAVAKPLQFHGQFYSPTSELSVLTTTVDRERIHLIYSCSAVKKPRLSGARGV